MRIKHGVTTLKKELDAIRHPPEVVDVVAIMHTARDAAAAAHRAGLPPPARAPIPPDWETSPNPRKRALFAARRRCGP